MKKAQLNAVWEGIKEPLRELILAIIPFLLTYFQAIPQTWAVILYLVLRGVEKFLYEYKPTNNNIVTKILKFE